LKVEVIFSVGLAGSCGFDFIGIYDDVRVDFDVDLWLISKKMLGYLEN
jgi:hypothetical protein